MFFPFPPVRFFQLFLRQRKKKKGLLCIVFFLLKNEPKTGAVILIIFLLYFCFFPVFCLKDLKIFVPDAVIMGNAVTLSCQYDLEKVGFKAKKIMRMSAINRFCSFAPLQPFWEILLLLLELFETKIENNALFSSNSLSLTRTLNFYY